MSKNKPQIDYAAILADLEAKKQALDALIVSVKVAAATGAVAVGDLPTGSLEGLSLPTTLGASGGDGKTYTIDDIPAGAFHGKSISEAAWAYLDMMKTKQTTKEISDALRKGGIESTSSNFENLVYVVLYRVCKKSGKFARVSGKWALSEWLHASLRNTGSQQSTKKKKKAAKKAKKKSKKTKQATGKKKVNRKTSSGVRDKIAFYMEQHPNTEYSVDEVAKAVGITKSIAGLLLGKLVSMNHLRKTENRKYHYISPVVH